MRKAIGTDRRRDPQRVLDVLHEIDADVVALQEADKRFGGRGSAVPHELIDEHGVLQAGAVRGAATAACSSGFPAAIMPSDCSSSKPATSAGTAMRCW